MLKPLAIAALASLTLLSATAHAETAHVAITQIVEHPALDSVRKGVQDELAAHGYTAGQNLTWTYESAQGNVATAAQIARKFAGASPNVIVAIATPSAQTMVAAARNTPVIFSAVTDPLAAKLVTNMEKPGGNVTGITDMLPLERHIELMLRIKPDAKRIGTVYNPGEANAAALVEQLEAALKPRGITLIRAAATRTSEVLGAARSLVGKVDLIYLTTDNTVI
ncbi:MAG: ABC transporter substrate-binding protein, partial [Gammaproteobacteria bacterium]|nr:ABC transporter substrate-binding protein [Gammaproteobacteria bacterium]